MRLALALSLALVAGSADAMMAPQYYEEARDKAPDVVVISVDHITPPPGGADHGECLVAGQVAKVERGGRYRQGAAISIAVPCARATARIPDGGTIWQDWDVLFGSRRGRAFLTADGTLALSQYDVLP